MDPFESLPEEVHDTLLQYFTVWEILDVVSLLSKSSYQAVGSSNVCMKRLKLNLRSQRKTNFEDRIETIKWISRKGCRSYQHLQINCLLDETTTQEVLKFFEAVGESVETINVRSMKIQPEEPVNKLSMPKLEELKMMFIPRQAMNALLTSTSNLKTLILRNEFPLCYDSIDYNPSAATVGSIKELFQKNEKLVDLELQGRPHFLSFYKYDLTKFTTFKLKKLVVKIEMSPEKVDARLEENFIKFLSHQSDSLEYVYVDNCSPNIIQHVFNNMPAVKFIRFDIMLRPPNEFVIKDILNIPNENVTQLELPYVECLQDVKDFLEIVPNVEEILVGHIVPLLLDFAAKNFPKLRSIVYRYDDCAGGCDKCYEIIKQNPELNQNIKLTLCNDFL